MKLFRAILMILSVIGMLFAAWVVFDIASGPAGPGGGGEGAAIMVALMIGAVSLVVFIVCAIQGRSKRR